MIENFEDILSLAVLLAIILGFLVVFFRHLNIARAKKLIRKEQDYYHREDKL